MTALMRPVAVGGRTLPPLGLVMLAALGATLLVIVAVLLGACLLYCRPKQSSQLRASPSNSTGSLSADIASAAASAASFVRMLSGGNDAATDSLITVVDAFLPSGLSGSATIGEAITSSTVKTFLSRA